MSATFTGSRPITYQWYFTNTNGVGPTAIFLVPPTIRILFAAAQYTNAGTYFVTAANNPPGRFGTTTANSTAAPLYLAPAGQNNTVNASVADGGISPFTGSYDIYQLTDSQVAPPTPSFYVDSGSPPGQIFTTGSTPPDGYSGFPLNYVYVKHDPTGNNNGLGTAQTYTLRVYQMLDATNAQLLTSYVTTNTLAITSGDWIRVGGLTNLLQPNTTYAFSFARNTTGYWRMACTVYASPGPNGQAVALPVQGGAALLSSPDAAFGYYYDAAFVAGMTPPTIPVSFDGHHHHTVCLLGGPAGDHGGDI